MTALRRGRKKSSAVTYSEMAVQGFALDSLSQAPMVLLKNDQADITFPVWLTTLEAVTVAAELINRDAVAERGCRDLMTRLLEQLQVEIESISIDALEGGMLDVSVNFSRDEGKIRVKVQPCEAIVMALKYSLPVRVSTEVLERASTLDMGTGQGAGEDGAGRFVRFLEDLDPKDMGKYPM
jgi:bifunctional DNase/RNase